MTTAFDSWCDGYGWAVKGAGRGYCKNADALAGWKEAVADGKFATHPDYNRSPEESIRRVMQGEWK